MIVEKIIILFKCNVFFFLKKSDIFGNKIPFQLTLIFSKNSLRVHFVKMLNLTNDDDVIYKINFWITTL